MKFLNQKEVVFRQLLFTPEAEAKMWALVETNQKEIGWHGTIEQLDDTTFMITDILVYPQTVTGATITCDDNKYGDWFVEQATTNKDFDKIRFHGHSHVNMACFPSAVDTELQQSILKQLGDDEVYVFMIVNKKKEFWINIIDNKNGIIFETEDICYLPNCRSTWATEQNKEFVSTYKPASNYSWSKPATKSKPVIIDDDDDYEYYERMYNQYYGLK